MGRFLKWSKSEDLPEEVLINLLSGHKAKK